MKKHLVGVESPEFLCDSRAWRASLTVALSLMFIIMMDPRLDAKGGLSYVSSNLELVIDSSGNAVDLTNRLTGANWLRKSGSLYRLSGGNSLTKSVSYTPLSNGEILLTLTLTNPTTTDISVAPTFPCLAGLNPGAGYGNLTYCFPQIGKVASTTTGLSRRSYGGDFPMQFMDVYDGAAGGVYVMTHDLSDASREYEVNNVTAAGISLFVVYASQTVKPGTSWILKSVIGAHKGDWHASLAAYRNWVATWYAPLVPRKCWFQDVYNLRELFLHANTAIGDTPAYDPATKAYSFSSLLARDQAAFGGDDYVHLFDWSQTPAGGRVGDYDPWNYLGGIAAFSNQVAQIQASGCPVGLYFEGYLLAKNSTVGQEYGAAWQLLDSSQQPYTSMGVNYYYPCPSIPAWRDYIAGKCAAAISNSGANGVYIDEFGFGWQYPCYNSDHGHEAPGNQVQLEGAIMRQLRLSLPPSTVLYSEERNTDVNSQYQDGSFTYSISKASTDDNPSRVNLARFALPDYKVFEILNVDAPVGDDPQLYMSVFFNGEGIWLEGPVGGPDTWFPPNVCSVITKTHAILRKYADAFRSANPIPLVPTLNSTIYANEFPTAHRTVWTLYNAGGRTAAGELLVVPHCADSQYFDAWNAHPLTPRISGTEAYLTISIAPGSAGCVVQEKAP